MQRHASDIKSFGKEGVKLAKKIYTRDG